MTVFLCAPMGKREAVIVSNTVIYSRYKGYGSTFAFHERDSTYLSQKTSLVTCIDAIRFKDPQDTEQYTMRMIQREISKSYIGFKVDTDPSRKIASGKWGCGAFNGNKYLKLLI